MVNPWTARDIASRLVRTHGRSARAVAEATWRDHETAGDNDATDLWVHVAIEVGVLLDARLSLAETLEDPITKAVMKADGVTREDLDTILRDAKAKRS